jgi:hypothetical protein
MPFAATLAVKLEMLSFAGLFPPFPEAVRLYLILIATLSSGLPRESVTVPRRTVDETT